MRNGTDTELDDIYNGLAALYERKGLSPPQIIAKIGEVSSGNEVLGISTIEWANTEVVDTPDPAENTAYHYRKLAELLRKNNIRFIAMQYPNTSIAPLVRMLDGYPEVSIVSNEGSFRRALETTPYEKLFTDHMTPKFGHTTKEGSLLISEDAYQAIAPIVDRIRGIQ